jgi:DNA-binding NarL/FixJ family response regulator
MRIVVLTGIDSALYIHNMLKEGASGYVLKNSASSVIVNAIETVRAGSIYLEQALQEKLERFRTKLKNKKTLKPSLTVKEKEVLTLTVQGYSIPEISEKIFLGRRTIEYYRSNLLLKFDVRNVAELIRKVIETGVLD